MDSIVRKSLLIVDDHPIYRDALCEKISYEFIPEGIDVQAASGANEGLEILENSQKQWVVLLDVLMPGLSGLAGIKLFNELHNVRQVVAISGLDEHVWEPKTVSAGAAMFLSKNSTADLIVRKLKPLMLVTTEEVLPNQVTPPAQFRLTQRQLEVLDLISQGHPNKIIANYLEISEQTVKIHINLIFKELRVFNRMQAVLKAQKNGLLK